MTTRRHFLTQLAGAASLGGLASLGLVGWPARAAAANAGAWHMPDEHGPQERVFLAFAAQPLVWGEQTDAVNTAVARLARSIARHQPVSVLCRPAQRRQAQDRCGNDNIEFLDVALDDIWVRDYGGCFVTNDQGGLGLVDFNFNGWGGKQSARNDGAGSTVAGADDRRDAAGKRSGGRGRWHRSRWPWHRDPDRKLLGQPQPQSRLVARGYRGRVEAPPWTAQGHLAAGHRRRGHHRCARGLLRTLRAPRRGDRQPGQRPGIVRLRSDPRASADPARGH